MINDEKVEIAIRMRHEGELWVNIARFLGFAVQPIQLQIWKYLYTRNELTLATVRSVWKAPGKYLTTRLPSWSWIETTLGLYLQADGTVIEGKPLNTDRERYNAWGIRMANRAESEST
jgi:hypothetical protein